jgi:hypothetical protein
MTRRLLLTFVAAMWCAFAAAQPAQPGPPQTDMPAQPTLGDDKDTIEATRKWLSLLDSGKAGAAWDVASTYLKSVVTRQKWVTEITAARKTFGKLKERTPVRFARSHSMPGAPDGDYAFIELESVFVNGKQATEHVTWTLDKDEVWRVSGYFIR